MQNFQNDLQMLGMDHFQVAEVFPTDRHSQQFLEDPRRCGRCGGGGFHCGGHHCGGFRCGGFRCGGCGGCGGCYSCYSCYGCSGACYGSAGVIVI